MRFAIFTLCVIIGSAVALPSRPARSSALDLLRQLEDLVEEDGKVLIEKLVTVIHHVEDGVLQIKELVPKVYEKVHQEADEVLSGLKKVSEEIQELLGKKKALYGFDLLGSLTELPGGVKISTVLSLLSLADKAHRLANDAKEFAPHLQTTLQKIQAKFETHVSDFAKHVVKELGLQEFVSRSVVKKIETLFENIEEEAHLLILKVLHAMEQTFDIMEQELPELYNRFRVEVEEVRSQIQELVNEIEKTIVMRGFSLLDIAGNVTGGTSLGTVFKVMSLLDKFNTVVQDARNFEPRAQKFLEHSVKRVAETAQDFFNHASNKLFE